MTEEIKRVDVNTKFTLTTLTEYLNQNYKKNGYKEKDGFSVSDVQGYIKRGYLPSYIQKGYQIQICKCLDIPGAKVYKLREVKIRKN